MKKNIIILVVIVITISLLGLVGIQLYWIRNAWAVKEVHFERGVSDAISEAIYKYNKLVLAQKLLFQDKHKEDLSEFYNVDPSSLKLFQEIVVQHTDTIDLKSELSEISVKGGYLSLPDNKEIVAQSFLDRSKIIEGLLEDLFTDDVYFRLSAELNKYMLDSLIKLELNNHGIYATFEYGIYNAVKGDLSAEKTGNYSRELLERGYVFSLFPSSIFNNPEYLLIYFPSQKHYILAQMNFMMMISTILIIVIISSFAYTIITVIRQKKLSIMKNDFINNMTHELKTPISTISLACQALSDRDVQKSEKLYQNYINIIDEENQRLEMMTEKVLQTALLDKGKLSLNYTEVDIHELLEEAIKKIGLQVHRSRGMIIKQFETSRSFIKADKFHLTNVFFNLLDNANKYSELPPEIIVATRNNPEGVFVNVKDNGIGISKANQQKVFENLYRIATGNIHNVKGFGLGLAYVKNIVELHNGEVFLESEINKGTTFTIFVPFGINERSTI